MSEPEPRSRAAAPESGGAHPPEAGLPPRLLKALEDNTRRLAASLAELSESMAASEDKIRRIQGRSRPFDFIRRLWRDGRIAREAEASLSQARALAAGLLAGLTENQLHLDSLMEHLGARLDWLTMENLRLKKMVLQMGESLAGRLERLEDQAARDQANGLPPALRPERKAS